MDKLKFKIKKHENGFKIFHDGVEQFYYSLAQFIDKKLAPIIENTENFPGRKLLLNLEYDNRIGNNKFARLEHVLIKKYKDDETNRYGMIDLIVLGNNEKSKYHVTNMNMPYCGTVSEVFEEDELEKIK